MNRTYRTIKAAREALALDVGFDPFVAGHIQGRCTKAALAELGYIVDREAADRETKAISQKVRRQTKALFQL